MIRQDNILNSYELTLLNGWEEVYKRGQLTLWILLALKDGPKHMAQIKQFIENASKQTISADDKSMYRALRRFQEGFMVNFKLEPSPQGPDKKIYYLTGTGSKVLQTFIDRNITKVLLQPAIKDLLTNTTHENH